MPSTYTLNNGIELIGTGEQSGTWGDTTNTNFELLDTALDGQVSVTLAATGSSGSPNTLPISDGASSNGRNRLVIFGDGGDLGGTAFVQLTPNDAEKIIYVRNNLSGSRSILLFQGTYNASNDYEVPAGTTAVVFFNGAGSGAVAANVFNNAHFDALNVVGSVTVGGGVTVTGTVDAGTVEFDNLSGTGAVSVTNILDEDNMASNSATALSTQQSIKAYVDSQVGTVDTLAEILANGNTTGGTDIAVSAGDDITFADSSKAIFGAGSDLQIYHDGNSYIKDLGAGNLSIMSDGGGILMEKTDGENIAFFDTVNSNVELFEGGIKRLETTSTGIDVTGTLDVNNGANSTQAIFSGTAGRGLVISTESVGAADEGVILNATASGTTGKITFQTNDATSLELAGNGGTGTFHQGLIVNEDSAASGDFRVESDSNANMLFVDAGNNHVNIGIGSDRGGVLNVYGTGTPIAVMESEADGTVLSLRTTDTDANAGPNLELYRNATGASNDNLGSIIIKGTDASAQDQVYFSIGTQISAAGNGVEASTVYFQNAVAGSLRERITMSSSALVINQEGLDNDFRVESDGLSHAMFLDGSGNGTLIFGDSSTINGANGEFLLGSGSSNTTYFSIRNNTTSATTSASSRLDLGVWTNNGAYPTPSNTVTGNINFMAQGNDNAYGASGISSYVLTGGNLGRSSHTARTIFYNKDTSASSAIEYMRFDGGEKAVVINQEGYDADFRVESDGNSGMLVVDAAGDQVRMGNASATTPSSVASLVARTGITTDYSGSLTMSYQAGTYTDYYKGMTGINPSTSGARGLHIFNYDNDSDGGINFWSGRPTVGTPVLMATFGPSNVIFNDNSADRDFRVESVGNANMIGLDSANNTLGIGKFGSTSGAASKGAYFNDSVSGFFHFVVAHENTTANNAVAYFNRQSSDGNLIEFRQADSAEGTISVSGSTVSYNGFSGRHESSGIPANTSVGTVVSTIDALDVYPDTTENTDGNTIPHAKAGQTRADHAKVEVSTSVGDPCVYGVVSEFDGDGKLIVTSVGIGSIRVTGACAKGDLLESNGDGTAKVQSDDIVRSKTIGKVTIGNSDTGVKLVSCVMYCG